jgi:hypothetical protein
MFTLEKRENNWPLAIIRGGADDGKIIYLEDKIRYLKGSREEPCVELSLLDKSMFEQIPSSMMKIIYVVGASGAGKSFWASKYIDCYLKIFSGAKFYLFSNLEKDEIIDKLNPLRLILDESIFENPLQISDIEKGSIILFDSADCFTNKKIQNAVDIFRDQLLEKNKNMNISIIITSHMIGKDKLILTNTSALILFPHRNNLCEYSSTLTKYFGYSKSQINHLSNISSSSRWLSIINVYPRCIIIEKYMVINNQI